MITSVKYLKNKYPHLSSQIDDLKNRVKQKYIDWIIRQLYNGESQEELLRSIDLFDRKLPALAEEHRDILKFNSLSELKRVLNDLENKVRRTVEVKDEPAKKLFENERYVLIRPDTKLAACSFGSGTRWCVTSQEVPHYENYINFNTVIYYLIDKTLPSHNPLYKVAFATQRDLDNKVLKIEAFGSNDKIYDPENITGYNLAKEIIIKDVEAFPAGAVVYAMEGLLSLEEFNHFMSVAISVGADFDISVFPKKYQYIEKRAGIISYIMEHNIQYNQKIQAYKYLNNEFRSILTEKETDPRILDKLSKDNDKDVRRYVAANNNTSPVTLDLLAKDNEEYVRRNVAKNKNTSPETLALLAKDNDFYIRINVTKNKNTSSETLAFLAKDNEEYVRRNVAENNNTSPEILALLAKDNYAHVRQNVAKNKNTSSETLAFLAKDNEEYVRRNVAENNNTSPETLALLAKDNDVYVRQNVAGNNNTPLEILSLLAKDDDKYVRQYIAENNNTSPEISVLLAKDNNEYVRQNVARNNNTPQETLALLVEDNDVSVRRLVASNSNTSQETLAIFAKDNDKDVRKNVAKNNNTPQETLVLLAKDSDKGVRQAVTKNKNVTPEILTLIDEYEAAKPKRILPPREFPKKEFDNNYIINFGTEEQRLKFIDSNPPVNDLKLLAKHFNISYKVQLKLLDLNNDEINAILLDNYAVDPEIKKIILSGRDDMSFVMTSL